MGIKNNESVFHASSLAQDLFFLTKLRQVSLIAPFCVLKTKKYKYKNKIKIKKQTVKKY